MIQKSAAYVRPRTRAGCVAAPQRNYGYAVVAAPCQHANGTRPYAADFRITPLEASGSADVAANQLRLRARNLPANVTILPLASRQAGFVPNLGGSPGTLCLGGLVGRDLVHVGTSTAWGEAAYAPDLANLPTPNTYVAALLGETWHFQLWYRDLATIGGSNLTDAVAVTLQ